MKPEIQSISLEYPNCDDGTTLSCEVGIYGVTKIVPAVKNGEMAEIIYYEIWRGENLYCELHHFSQIIYKEPSK